MDILKVSRLIDNYGKLLTSRQYDIVTDYYFNNLSLSEIGDNLNISRQAVNDSLKSAIKILQDYEDKLGIISKLDLLEKEITSIIQHTQGEIKESLQSIVEKLRS